MLEIPFKPIRDYRIIYAVTTFANMYAADIYIITDDYEACKISECAIGVSERCNDKCA